MFDIGWSELFLVAVLAILVVGPKELPRALRTMGQWAARVRGIAREFQNSVDDMIRESELEELRQQAQSLVNVDVNESLQRHIEADPPADPSRPADDAAAAADGEAAADDEAGYRVEGAMAPAHSLGGAEEAGEVEVVPEESGAEKTSSEDAAAKEAVAETADVPEPSPEAAPTRLNG